MLTPIIGAWSILELVFVLLLLIPMGWATNLDRRGDSNPKWVMPFVFLFLYWAVYMIAAPAGDWLPVFMRKAFWTDVNTWYGIGKYLSLGIVYAMVELLSTIVEEKQRIKANWAAFLEKKPDFAAWTKGNYAIEHLEYRELLRAFSVGWNSWNRFVKLQAHALDRTPTPGINFDLLLQSVCPWILLWPGYLVSLFFGRILERVTRLVTEIFRIIGTAFVRIVFRNTFN